MSQYYDKMPQQAEASYPFQHVQPPGYVHQQQDYVPPQHYSHNQHGSPSLNAGQCHCLNCSADGQDRSGSPYPPVGESASYYDGSSFSQQQSHGQEGEKGLGSTVIGGAAGGYAAHQMGGGKLATAGGAVLGAVGMNMVNHKLNKPNPPAQQVTYVQSAPAPATVMAVPVDGGLGLGSGLGVGSGLGLGSGLGVGRLGRAHRVIGRRRLGMY